MNESELLKVAEDRLARLQLRCRELEEELAIAQTLLDSCRKTIDWANQQLARQTDERA